MTLNDYIFRGNEGDPMADVIDCLPPKSFDDFCHLTRGMNTIEQFSTAARAFLSSHKAARRSAAKAMLLSRDDLASLGIHYSASTSSTGGHAALAR